MENTKIVRVADLLKLQVAAESFLHNKVTLSEQRDALRNGNQVLSKLPLSIVNRSFVDELGSSGRFKLVSHIEESLAVSSSNPDTPRSGLSATLFYDSLSSEYVLSIRSTEFDSQIRDWGDIFADSEILNFGWAFGQINSLERFWNYLTTETPDTPEENTTTPDPSLLENFRSHIADGGRIAVTGYSLGGNLAQAFTKLHDSSVHSTYLFNAAGTGISLVGLENALSLYQQVYAAPQSIRDFIGPTPFDSIVDSVVHSVPQPDFLYFDPRHLFALSALETVTIGAFVSEALSVTERQQNDKITDIWAAIDGNSETLETVVASYGVRHGSPQQVWYENQPLAYLDSALPYSGTNFSWATGHSIVLLQDSLSVMALFEQIAPDVNIEQIGRWFESGSFNYYDSLERALNTVAALVGVEPLDLTETQPSDIEFANMQYRNLLHEKIYEIRDSALFTTLDELEEDESASFETVNLSTIVADAKSDFSAFLALYHGSPFQLIHEDLESFYEQHQTHSALYASWQQDIDMSEADRLDGKANFTEAFFADRLFLLSNFFSIASSNQQHGELSEQIKFTDLVRQLVFDGDSKGYANDIIPIPVLGPEAYDDERARISFGTQESDVSGTSGGLQVSNEDDSIHALGGNDIVSSLDGNDHIEGGNGNDDLRGGEGSDTVVGGNGNDFLYGGEGRDYLIGGRGSDQFHWTTGAGIETILDRDDGGDRIYVNGIDLATLNFEQLSPNSTFYVDLNHASIVAAWDGDGLTVHIGTGAIAGRIEAAKFDPTTGSSYGITLNDYSLIEPQASDVTVIEVGNNPDQTDWEASWRAATSQGGIDWANSTITLDMRNTANFEGNSESPVFGSVRFDGGPINDELTGDDFNQSLNGLGDNDVLLGLGGDDMLSGWQGSDTLHGGAGTDYLFGNTRHELTHTLAPSDFLYAFIAEQPTDINTLDGGSGDDFISGGERTDIASGGDDNDYLWGGAGNDNLNGGAGADVILGDSSLGFEYEQVGGLIHAKARTAFIAPDDISATYDDIAHGGDGNDFIWGELGNDILYGGSGNDYLVGDREASPAFSNAPLIPYQLTFQSLDELYHGNDELFGGDGNDFLLGLDGNDVLAGGTGNDQLWGGGGDDAYVYAQGDGNDNIIDEEGQHTLVFQGVQAESLVASFQGDNVHIGLRDSSSRDGFTLARAQWSNLSIAINSADNVIDRARVEQNYFDGADQLILSIAGSRNVSESDRDALFSVDDTNPERPVFNLGSSAESVEVVADYYGLDAHLFRISRSDTIGTRFDAPSSVDIEQRFPSSNWENFDWLTFANVNTRIVGVSNVQCGVLDDHVIGTSGTDEIYGLGGDDFLEGLEGNDALFGGTGRNTLIGGKGDDYLAGGGSALYEFYAGDGHDQLDTPLVADLNFNGINAEGLRLIYTGDQNTTFDIVTGSGNTITATGSTNIGVLSTLTVDGYKVPIVQQSNLANGVFFGSRLDDIFEVGSGNDVIHANAWGTDTYRFGYGDGVNTLVEDSPLSREYHGAIEFASDVTFDDIRFRFDRFTGDAWIQYGSDEIYLDGGLYPNWHNPLALFTLTSASDPAAAPVIRAADNNQGQWLYGSYGTDHIISDDAAHIIRPGYGNDLIEAGGGDDQIILSDHYMHEPSDQGRGIGRKRIIGGRGNDTVIAPLHQGLTFVYQLGDGNDIIEYDWSYDEHDDRYAYLLDLDLQQQTIGYTPRGQDTLELGPGLAIDDLSFTRIGNNLEIYAANSNGSLLIKNFFVAYQIDASGVSAADLFQQEGFVADALTHPAVLALMPDIPISRIQLANGQSISLQTLLDEHMVDLDVPAGVTLLGTTQDDVIVGNMITDDIIVARQGNDSVTVTNGSNYIDAGSGDDLILIHGGNNTVLAGTGNDVITLHNGTSVVDAGDGIDRVLVTGGQHHISGGNHFNSITLSGGDNRVTLGQGSDGIFVTGGSHTIEGYDGNGGLVSISVAQHSGASVILEMAATLRPQDVILSQLEAGSGYFIMVDVVGSSAAQPLNAFVFDPLDPELTPQNGSALSSIVFSNGIIWQESDILALATANQIVPLQGTATNDELIGGNANDVINGAGGDDILFGGIGNDVLDGGDGNDQIEGGAGNDTVLGGAGDDTLLYYGTNNGFDDINGGEGFDVMLGGVQNDVFGISNLIVGGSIERIDGGGGTFNVISGNSNNNSLDFSNTELVNILAVTGGAGDDTITGSQQNNILIGGDGNDTLSGRMGDDLLSGDAGDDTFLVSGTASGFDIVRGGEGFDTLLGSADNDLFGLTSLTLADSLERIDGGTGVFDVIIGDNTNNALDFSATEILNILAIAGGAGNDDIIGSSADDFILGGQGHDVLTGGIGNDTLRGDAGNDNFHMAGVGQGYDHVSGGAGADSIIGSAGNDLFGLTSFAISDSVELIDGGEGVFDVISGDFNDNTLDFSATELRSILAITGGAGNDTLIGSTDGEIMLGDIGDDALRGGKGNDILNGGLGDDRYWFSRGDGADVLQNGDSEVTSTDQVMFQDAQFDELWFSRSGESLAVNVVGTNDSVTVDNWYSDEASTVDEFHASQRVLHRNQIDQLVSAMSAFDVPVGEGAIIPQDTRLQLDTTITAVWQAA